MSGSQLHQGSKTERLLAAHDAAPLTELFLFHPTPSHPPHRIASGSQQAVGEGSNTLAIAANGAFATPVSAGTGGLAAVQATGTGAVAAYGSRECPRPRVRRAAAGRTQKASHRTRSSTAPHLAPRSHAEFVTNDILDGFAFGTQSATAVGSNPRASIGSLALSQSTGTFSEGLTSSQVGGGCSEWQA